MFSDDLKSKLEDLGYISIAEFDASKLEAREDVRHMCAVDKCHMYNKTWSCPPGCGTLEECAAEMAEYKRGIIFQTVGRMEDKFDYLAIQEAMMQHEEGLRGLAPWLIGTGQHALLLGAGACTLCETCTYPDKPCVRPEIRSSSMEAYGLLVSDVCKLADIPYYHGELTTSFTSCVLF